MNESLVPERLREQERRNLATRDAWERFAPHRRRVTDLLISERPPGPPKSRLAVLGAGNCNDLDLASLRAQFEAIDLVDCDRLSVLEGIARQGLANDHAIQAVGPVDLSATHRPQPLPIPKADAVASLCLLSQILENLTLATGAAHPQLLDLVKHERLSHFRLMIDLLLPGGVGLFVTDLVSSDTTPQLLSAQAVALPELARTCLENGNFFTGLNPSVIHALLTADPVLGSQVAEVVVVPPWTWNLGSRVYLVYAVRFRRVAG